MITDFLEFKKYQLIREFNSSFETSYLDTLPYGMREDILMIKNDIQEERKKNVSFKKVFAEVLDKIITLPYTMKRDIVKYALVAFAGSIALSDVSYAFASAKEGTENSDYAKLEKETISLIDDLKLNPMKNIDMSQFKTPTTYSDTLVDFLKHEEGRNGKPVLTAYDIKDGMITIGYGHAERKSITKMKAGVTKITEDQALDLLLQDVKEAQKGVDRIMRDMKAEKIDVFVSQNMYDAMISLTYNMGIGNMRKSDFLKMLKAGDIEGATKQILIQNVTYPGHVKRRKKEAFYFAQKVAVKIDQLLAVK
jgi:lysozyme